MHNKSLPGLPLLFLKTSVSDPIHLLVDTGSSISLLSESLINNPSEIQPVSLAVKAVTGDKLPITGICTLQIVRNGKTLPPHSFYVTPRLLTEFDGILGNDWFTNQQATINYAQSCVETNSVALPFKRTVQKAKFWHLTLTQQEADQFDESLVRVKTSEEKVEFVRSSDKTDLFSEQQKPTQFSAKLGDQNREVGASASVNMLREHEKSVHELSDSDDDCDSGIDDDSFRIYCKGTKEIPANSVGVLEVTASDRTNIPRKCKTFYVEPHSTIHNLKLGRTVLSSDSDIWYVPYVNFCSYPITLHRNDTIGWAEPVEPDETPIVAQGYRAARANEIRGADFRPTM